MKECIKCKSIKPLTEFHTDKTRRSGLRERCKDCRCKYGKEVHKKCLACGDLFVTSGKAKAQKYCGKSCQFLHIRYGIDEYKYEDMLISQGYKCAICRQEETAIDKRTGKVFELSVDHCHETGAVRGLLCNKCNTGLGYFRDQISILQNAIRYLQHF